MGAVYRTPLHAGKVTSRKQLFLVWVQVFVDRMNAWADKHGEQFRPAQILVDMAKTDKKFHP